MADKRDGEERVVFRPQGKSHEKEEGSAPQIHLQGSSAQGGPSLGTSSNIPGDLPDALEEREEGSSPRSPDRRAPWAHSPPGREFWPSPPLDEASFPPLQHRPWLNPSSETVYKHPDALKKAEEVPAPNNDDKASEEGFATKRQCETGERSSVIRSPPGDSGLTQGGDLVGLRGHKEQLIKLLLKDSSQTKKTTHVLVTGGSGMTTLVRQVCEDVWAMEKHFGAIAWISAPQINDPELIREEILLQLLFKNAPFPYDSHADDQEVKYFTNSSEYNNGRCLIVVNSLFDRRTTKTFQKVSRLFKRHKVIFIARRDRPINTYGHRCDIYSLDDLSVEEPWAHFRLKKSPEGDFQSPLKEVCQLLVNKFASLPAAILFTLHNRKERNDEWVPFILSFDKFPSSKCPSFNLIQQVLEILSNDDRLSCLLYLSIFPENSQISCKRVSRLWTAEGFVPDMGEAKNFLNDLLDRKCIHQVEKRSDGELSTFQVDNLVREIIVSFSDHLDLLRITSEGSTNWPERIRYLSVQGGTVKDLNEEKFSELRSLFVFDVSSNKNDTTTSEASPLRTSENPLFPFNVENLEVLDLTGAPLQITPDALFKSTFLRYLSLRDTSIEVIPDSIGRLTHLEFLDLKHSLVTELPKEVEGLERIQHILIYHHEKDPLMESYNLIGFKASCRIGGLKCLKKLCFVEADDNLLEDLGNLTKLTRLGITKLRKKHGELLCTSLGKLKELKSLNVHALDEEEILDLHCRTSPPESESRTSPPKFLKHLYLHGRLEKLPDWISSLDGLTKIILRWSHLEGATQQEDDLLATLGKLPNLVELELRRAYDGRRLDFKGGQFPKLKILLLDELGRLRSISLAEGTMPCIEDLTISRCQWLERIPTGIEQIPSLKALEFFEMSPEFYKMVPDDYRSSEKKPEVYFTQWRPGQWKTIPLGIDKCDECFAGEC